MISYFAHDVVLCSTDVCGWLFAVAGEAAAAESYHRCNHDPGEPQRVLHNVMYY